MMPKGVEHSKPCPCAANLSSVKIPMMPKGVEHMRGAASPAASCNVKIPMMPKGVEHFRDVTPEKVRAGEDSNDAERR